MVTVKSYAKLNISLKITGVNDGFHMLDSVVMTVDLYDLVTIKKRKDDKILVSFEGKYGFIPKLQEETNAYKAAKAFMEQYNTSGVNITIIRNIPTGSGMGGSSADIVGVLKGMKQLFKIDCDLKPLADSLGSDTGYLLTGGFARLYGRGEIVEPLVTDKDYYFVIMKADKAVVTKDCFKLYDEINAPSYADNDKVVEAIKQGDLSLLSSNACNDLYLPATKLNEEVEKNLNILKSLNPEYASMTGSGSTCFAIYSNYEMASWACDKLKKTYGNKVELVYYYNPERKSFFDRLSDFLTITSHNYKTKN